MQVHKRNARVSQCFIGEGYFDLCLPIGQLQQLEDLTDCGPALLLHRLSTGAWRTKDVKETIRLGLIGAGMSPREAFDLVDRHIVAGYLLDYVLIATVAVQAALIAPEDDPVGSPTRLASRSRRTTKR